MTENAASQNPPQDVPLTFQGAPRKRRSSEVVYFVQAAKLRLVKVGVAADFRDRFRNIRTGSPDELIVLGVIRADGNARVVEQSIHARFGDARHHGEWFQPIPELMAFISQNAVSVETDAARDDWENACVCLGALDGGGPLTNPFPGDDPRPAAATP